jgi:hypothetical protein
MTDKDNEYYAARLRVELAAAAAATNEGARQAHEGLAHLYADRLANAAPAPQQERRGDHAASSSHPVHGGGDAAGAR